MQDKLLTAFEAQRRACDMLGSPLTAAIVGFCRDDFAAGGPVADLVRGWQGDPLDDNVPSDTVTPIVVLVDVSASLFSAVAPTAVSVTSPVPESIAKYPSSLPLVIA